MPPSRAPRRKACQALLPDGQTPCSATFRGWGRYCPAHLDEHARLAGQYKDAAARTERLRRLGEPADKQVRALANANVADRALERVRAYQGALGDERRAREAYLRRFPVESRFSFDQDVRGAGSGSGGESPREGGLGPRPGSAEGKERSSSRGSRFTEHEQHEQRLAVLREREEASAALIEQLQQRREEILAASQQRRNGSSQVDLERQPLLVRETQRSRTGWLGWVWRIGFFVVLLGVVPLMVALTFLNRFGISESASI